MSCKDPQDLQHLRTIYDINPKFFGIMVFDFLTHCIKGLRSHIMHYALLLESKFVIKTLASFACYGWVLFRQSHSLNMCKLFLINMILSDIPHL